MNWQNEIEAAKKRDKQYRKNGQEILDVYTGKKKQPFNILYSNTDTLFPALYSNTPRPDVSRRFKDDDPMAMYASKASERMLEFLIDPNLDGYECFDDGMKAATLDALLPGRAVTSVKYEADIAEIDDADEEAETVSEEKEDEEEGELPDDNPIPYKKSELVCVNSHKWNRVLFGFAHKWSEVPWVAFEIWLEKDEAEKLLGEEKANELVYQIEKDETKEEKRGFREEEKSNRKVACVYQIWNKKNRHIYYVSEDVEGILKEEPDPLGLYGFYNIPKPMMFFEQANNLDPVALYKLYENQAEELNRIQQRINKVVEAIRARGFYDASLGDELADLIRAGDNELIPAQTNSSLAAEKGLDNAIWWMPIEQLTVVLQNLYQARESCKQVIYEITGISDILRGSTQASETATAQNLKAQWGSMRLRRMQKEVQRYCRDTLRLMLEVAVTKFSEDTWAKMTGLPFVTADQRAQDEQLFQVVQAQMQMQPPPQPGPNGEQPPPTPLMQEAQRLQAELQKPVWDQVLNILRDDLQRAYRVDIETNSTLEPEAAEDQKAIADMLNAFGQAMNGFGPMIQNGMLPFQVAQTILLAICRRYRFGKELEELVKGMQQPPPPQDPNAGKAQLEQQKMQQEMQRDQQQAQLDMQAEQLKLELERERMALEKERMALEMQAAREEHAIKMAELKAKAQLTEIVTASKIRIANTTAAKKEKEASANV